MAFNSIRPAGSTSTRSLGLLLGLLAFLSAACASSGAAAVTSTTKTSSTSSVADTIVPTAPSSTDQPAPTSSLRVPTKSILELAKGEGTLTTLLQLLDTAGLTTLLNGPGPFTLIAPTDAAFARMDKVTLDRITHSPDVLTALLKNHIVARRLSTKDVASGSASTMEGSTIALEATSRLPKINGLTVTRGARATNGTILVIDFVLIPVDLKLP